MCIRDRLFTEDIKDKFFIDDATENELKKAGKTNDTIIITKADSIIEIVRLFQRAWRLHTTPIIPSGRTGGKVSPSVFMEYEYLGSSSPGDPEKPGPGPWRNIELFDNWNNAVTDILSDTKFTTTIFSDDAKFDWKYEEGDITKKAVISKKLLKSSTYDSYNFNSNSNNYKVFEAEDKDEKEDVPKPLGKILLRFINKLLNDGEFYRGSRDGGGGALQQFLDEYFSLDSAAVKRLGGLSYAGFGDIEKNQETGGDMAKQTNCIFKNVNQVEEINKENGIRKYLKISEDSKGLVFKIKVDGKDKYLYTLKKIRNTVWFIVFDAFGFDSKNIRITPAQPVKVNTVQLFSIDVTSSTIEFKRDKTVTVQNPKTIIGEELKTEIKFDSDPFILVYGEGDKKNSPFLDCTMNNMMNKFKLKNEIKKYNNKLI